MQSLSKMVRSDIMLPLVESIGLSYRREVPTVDAAISCPNKNVTYPMDKAQVFKDSVDKKLESLLKASFAMQSAAVYQSLKNCLKQLVRKVPPHKGVTLVRNLQNCLRPYVLRWTLSSRFCGWP